jgi:hypothetical protein
MQKISPKIDTGLISIQWQLDRIRYGKEIDESKS